MVDFNTECGNFICHFHFITPSIPCGKFRSPYLGKATAAARPALPSAKSSYGIFVCANEDMAASACDL